MKMKKEFEPVLGICAFNQTGHLVPHTKTPYCEDWKRERKIESCPECGAIYSMMEPDGITDWGCSNVFHSRGRVAASSKEATANRLAWEAGQDAALECAIHERAVPASEGGNIARWDACDNVVRAIQMLEYPGAEATPSSAPGPSCAGCGVPMVLKRILRCPACGSTPELTVAPSPPREETLAQTITNILKLHNYPITHNSKVMAREFFDAGARSVVVAHQKDHENKLRAIVRWLEANQPDVFKRGLWEAIDAAGKEAK